ncbi:hypothetical protein CcI6DRAFT_03423 [Frankia sp. CcI6]|uniref:hypothetical protein n=1 Tax=Frankia TaxID=1854 RepID=UPI0003D023BA|nr:MULTISPECIES: hypothetical protein [Frankia]ETA01178.1 hypothetical protein CcI6DRAFT_03423 [Frankia sp. CcI6]OAA22701.1 hypothetical protein AAY23_106152 [Frankia casuarinae]OHV52875.1 hypothetical protein CgIS1_15790 [Frankia sp. CgIS1]
MRETAPETAEQTQQNELIGPAARLATWVFVGCYLVCTVPVSPTARVGIPTTKIQVFLYSFLAVLSLVSRRNGATFVHSALRSLSAVLFIAAVMCFYSLAPMGPMGPMGPDGAAEYLAASLRFGVFYASIAVFAAFFFDRRHLEHVFWRMSLGCVWIALAGYAVAAVLPAPVWVDAGSGGTPRLRGLLAEPSSWAPVISVLILLAVRRRSWRNLALVVLAGLLTKSPTVLLTAAISLIFCYLNGIRAVAARGRRTIVLAAVLPLTVVGIGRIDPTGYLASNNGLTVAFGRLVAGLDALGDDTAPATANGRYTSARIVMAEARQNGHPNIGYGPNSNSVYLAQKYGDDRNYAANSLYVTWLFDFGRIGAYALLAAIFLVLLRLVKRPASAALFIPFLVASLINSAQGFELFKFAFVPVLLYLFGWERRILPGNRRQEPDLARRRPATPAGAADALPRRGASAGRSTPATA